MRKIFICLALFLVSFSLTGCTHSIRSSSEGVRASVNNLKQIPKNIWQKILAWDENFRKNWW